MATNLRLSTELETALRQRAARTGRSQQAIIREALELYLGLAPNRPTGRSLDELIAAGVVSPPREPFRLARRPIALPEGVTSADLLEREDRL